MSDINPFIDWATDADVIQSAKVSDVQAMKNGWCDAKVAGVLIFSFWNHTTTIFTAYDDHQRKSEYYSHFKWTLSRIPATSDEPAYFLYRYSCTFGHDGCQHLQKRSQGSTDKLKAKTMKCNVAHPTQAATPLPKQKTSVIKYNIHYHRMLVALRCTVSNWPFASVEDEYYAQEVELLHHSMHVHTSNTSSRLTYTCGSCQASVS